MSRSIKQYEDMFDMIYDMGFRRGKNSKINKDTQELIDEIMECINSGNRGSADYFIVDKIEEICMKYKHD